MYQINGNVVYVKGSKNGAIYNFNNGNVYSINSCSCSVIDKIINHDKLNQEELKYKNILENNGLIGKNDYNICKYIPPKKENKLKLVWLEITQACNCKCIHCYEGVHHNASTKQLDLEQWISCINQISELCVDRVVIIGGEPCTHKHISEITKYAVSKGLDTTIFTNGTIISDELIKVILKTNVKLKFSIYGHNSVVHDSITQTPGSFEKLISNIKFFKERGIHINLSVVIMRENEKYYGDIKKFVDSLNVDGYKFDVIREVFAGTQNKHIPCNKETTKSVMRTAPKFCSISLEKFSNAFYHNTCWHGKLVISEDGSVLPCVFERNTVLGNVCEQSITSIINNSETQKCWDLTFDNINECKECEFRFVCKDCRPLANATGKSFSKNPRCTYDVYKGEWT